MVAHFKPVYRADATEFFELVLEGYLIIAGVDANCRLGSSYGDCVGAYSLGIHDDQGVLLLPHLMELGLADAGSFCRQGEYMSAHTYST